MCVAKLQIQIVCFDWGGDGCSHKMYEIDDSPFFPGLGSFPGIAIDRDQVPCHRHTHTLHTHSHVRAIFHNGLVELIHLELGLIDAPAIHLITTCSYSYFSVSVPHRSMVPERMDLTCRHEKRGPLTGAGYLVPVSLPWQSR